jgi:hypothetical protein
MEQIRINAVDGKVYSVIPLGMPSAEILGGGAFNE